MNVVISGMPRAGKTVCGAILAKKLAFTFKNLDTMVEELFFTQSGQSLSYREIYQCQGVERFRQLEQEALKSIQFHQGIVIALGGGALENVGVREMVNTIGTVVYLKTPTALLWERMKRAPPCFLDPLEPYESLIKLGKEREEHYLRVADITVDAFNKSEDEVVALIINQCALTGGC